jgi:Neuraminidase (sialidase)
MPGFHGARVALAAGLVAAAGAGLCQPGLQIESRSVVFAYPEKDPYDPFNRYGFNHAPSVVTLPDGLLLAAWFSGPYEAAVSQVILAAVSSDGGRTWGQAFVLQDSPRRSDFDPAFIADEQRTWFFYTAGRWNRYPFIKGEREAVGVKSYYLYYRYSDDSGKTWSEPVEVGQGYFCRSNGIRLTTGELLLPVYRQDPEAALVMRSTDGGKTWAPGATVKSPAGADEPTIVELKSGEVLMGLRTNDGAFWTTTSEDRGQTWSEPVKTGLPATCTSHNLFRLPDGRVVLTHDENPRYRTPLTMRTSDDGKTWSEPLVIAECPIPQEGDPVWNLQVTYPSVAQAPDGALVVVYSEIVMADYPERSEQYGVIHAVRVSAAN